MGELITREELKLSLRHYWRMRQWVRKKICANDKARNAHLCAAMYAEIGETWSGQYCVLCLTHIDLSSDFTNQDYDKLCGMCPININGCNCNIDNSAYKAITKATTWSELATALTNMANTILSLPREVK